MENIVKFYTTLFIFIIFVAKIFCHDWQAIDNAKLKFPKDFLFGTATAEYQNSGATNCPNNNWAKFEDQKNRIKNNQKSNKSCDHYNRIDEDILLMKMIGINSYRFSIEWSLIEPEEGVFDENAIDHYANLINQLIKANIKPMITLHHLTNPLWFEKKNAFEVEENIFYFKRFSKKVFEKFSDKVSLWCTINEPALYVFCGYLINKFPPGKSNPKLAGRVLKNLLKAHIEIYKELKSLKNGKESQIGIVHNYLQFEPNSNWNLIEKIASHYLSQITNQNVLKFFKTGIFSYYIPLLVNEYFDFKKDFEENNFRMTDFVGLNYYTNPLLKFQLSLKEPLKTHARPNEIMCDMPYRLYPEGIYEAIKEVSTLNVPIYITENGMADKNDSFRKDYIKRYLYFVSKAIEDGFDVKGYYYWTLMDNFEWDEGFLIKFGLYDVNFNTKERVLKNGSKAYIDIINDFKSLKKSFDFNN